MKNHPAGWFFVPVPLVVEGVFWSPQTPCFR
jgi:hypothetical protein